MKIFKANDGKEYVVTNECDLEDKTIQRNLQATVDALDGVDPVKHYGEVVPLDLLKFTDWSPDTCGCTLRYIWRRDHDNDVRVHYPHRSVRHCAHHDNHKGNHDNHYAAVHAENTSKNWAISKAAAFYNKNPSEFIWKHDGPNRALRVAHPDIGEIDHASLPEPDHEKMAKIPETTAVFVWQD